MDNYDRVARSVEPKREQLRLAEASHATCMVTLNEKLVRLREVEARREKLEDLFAKTAARKAELQTQVDSCIHKINRASELLERLDEEKERWEAELALLTGRSQKCIVEALLSSAYLVYAGAFPQHPRAHLVAGWTAASSKLCSAIVSQFDIIAAIGDPVRIRFWHVCGLPTDAFSTANAILVEAASRHALCIDPHSQVGSWIRNTQKRWKLVRLTSRDTELSQKVMEAADTGALVLVEDFRDTDNLDFLLDIASARAASSSRGPGASAEASIEQPGSAARRATARSSQVASDIARNLLGSAERKQHTLSAAMSEGFRLIITTSLHKPQFRVRDAPLSP